MYTQDIHSARQSVDAAMHELDVAIGFGKKDKDRVLCLIVGYGSQGKTHKIRTAAIERLKEYKEKGRIKDFICGGDLYIFSSAFLTFKYGDRIPKSEKDSRNPGAIYVIL